MLDVIHVACVPTEPLELGKKYFIFHAFYGKHSEFYLLRNDQQILLSKRKNHIFGKEDGVVFSLQDLERKLGKGSFCIPKKVCGETYLCELPTSCLTGRPPVEKVYTKGEIQKGIWDFYQQLPLVGRWFAYPVITLLLDHIQKGRWLR